MNRQRLARELLQAAREIVSAETALDDGQAGHRTAKSGMKKEFDLSSTYTRKGEPRSGWRLEYEQILIDGETSPREYDRRLEDFRQTVDKEVSIWKKWGDADDTRLYFVRHGNAVISSSVLFDTKGDEKAIKKELKRLGFKEI